jgi:hypothetical protein
VCGAFLPALGLGPELAVGRAARVVVAVQHTRVALLPLLHAGIPTHLAVPFLEADGGLEAQRLTYGDFTAVGETLWEEEGRERKKVTDEVSASHLAEELLI